MDLFEFWRLWRQRVWTAYTARRLVILGSWWKSCGNAAVENYAKADDDCVFVPPSG